MRFVPKCGPIPRLCFYCGRAPRASAPGGPGDNWVIQGCGAHVVASHEDVAWAHWFAKNVLGGGACLRFDHVDHDLPPQN